MSRQASRRWLLSLAIAVNCGMSAMAQDYEAPSVMRQPANAKPLNSVNNGKPINMAQRGVPTLAPAQADPNASTEKPPVSINAGQMLLKDAAQKASTAKDDGDLSEVIAIATEALKEKPGAEGLAYANKLLSWAHNRRGQNFAENQLYDQAVEDYNMALSYDPTMWRAVHNRGVAYAGAGKKREAMADFTKALEMNRGFVNTWYNRGELQYEMGLYDKAWKDFNEAVRVNNQDAASIAGRGKAAARMGKTREGLQDLDMAVKMLPKDASLRLQRADLYLAIRAHGTALEDYRAAATLNPQSGHALRGMAWIMSTAPDQRLRNAEEGVKLAQKAMELDGNNDPRYVETLAAAYANSGQFDAAAELLKHALESAKGDAAGRIQAQLAVYKEGKPFRDGPEPQSAKAPIPPRPVQTKQR